MYYIEAIDAVGLVGFGRYVGNIDYFSQSASFVKETSEVVHLAESAHALIAGAFLPQHVWRRNPPSAALKVNKALPSVTPNTQPIKLPYEYDTNIVVQGGRGIVDGLAGTEIPRECHENSLTAQNQVETDDSKVP